VRPDPDPYNQGYADGFSAGKSESDDTALLRQALEAIKAFREWEMGQDYNSSRETILAQAFEAEEALKERLK
jgi:hypothetical protein